MFMENRGSSKKATKVCVRVLAAFIGLMVVLGAMPSYAIVGKSGGSDKVSENIAGVSGGAKVLEQQKSKLEVEQKVNAAALNKLRGNKAKRVEYARTLQSQLGITQTQLSSCNKQLLQLNLDIDNTRHEIALLESSIAANTKLLKKRLVALYEVGTAGDLQILCSARGLFDLADKVGFVKDVTDHDMQLINTLKSDKSELLENKAILECSKASALKSKYECESKQKELTKILAETKGFLKALSVKETDLNSKSVNLSVQTLAAAQQLKLWQSVQEHIRNKTGSHADISEYMPDDLSAYLNKSDFDAKKYQSLPVEKFLKLITKAETQLGVPYKLGADTPNKEFDCSAFVCWAFRESGVYDIPRKTAQGIYDECIPVPIFEAQPGDIIFFKGTYDCGEKVTHVGIYVGDDTMIAAGSPIQYTSLNTNYWREHFYAFGRFKKGYR